MTEENMPQPTIAELIQTQSNLYVEYRFACDELARLKVRLAASIAADLRPPSEYPCEADREREIEADLQTTPEYVQAYNHAQDRFAAHQNAKAAVESFLANLQEREILAIEENLALHKAAREHQNRIEAQSLRWAKDIK